MSARSNEFEGMTPEQIKAKLKTRDTINTIVCSVLFIPFLIGMVMFGTVALVIAAAVGAGYTMVSEPKGLSDDPAKWLLAILAAGVVLAIGAFFLGLGSDCWSKAGWIC